MNATAWARWLLIAVIFLAINAGCKKRVAESTDSPIGTAAPVPEKKAENGWPLYEVPAEGFALALPADWQQIIVNPQTFENMIASVSAKNPGLAGMGDTLRQQAASGIKFFGFDKEAAATGRGTNVTVAKAPLPFRATLDSVVELNIAQIETVLVLIGNIKRERKKTPHAETERLQYQVRMKVPNGRSIDIVLTQYYFVTNTDYFLVTFTTGPERVDEFADTATAICESFRAMK